MAAKKIIKKTPNKKAAAKSDIFKRVYDTATGIVEKAMDIIQGKIDEIIHNAEKKVFYITILTFGVLFLLFAVSEFMSVLFPWYGRTGGYLIIAAILFIIALFYKKGMD